MEMVKLHIKQRAAPPRIGLNKSIQNALETVLGAPTNNPPHETQPTIKKEAGAHIAIEILILNTA